MTHVSHAGARPHPFRASLFLGAALILPAVPAAAQQAQELDAVVVETDPAMSDQPGAPVELDRARIAIREAATSDTAGIVATVPGVSLNDAGGVSGLPMIRGFDSQRLNILVDGFRIDDVCPNMMNPPLSYTDPQTVGSVAVLTGVTPVSMGGDRIGGAITVDSARPRFASPGTMLVTGRVSGFYRSNGDAFGGGGTITVANNRLSLTYAGSYTQSENYKGGGNDGTVRSTEYAKTDHSLALAAQTDLGLFELRAGIQRVPYEGFPNQYMDMTDNRSWFVSGRYRGYFGWGDVDLGVQYRDTDHVMNFLADKGGTASGGMPMNTEGHTAGYSLKLSLPVSSRDTLRLGSEFHHQWLDDYWPPVPGNMMMGPNTFVNLNAAHRDRLGSFVEWESRWSDRVTTTLGVRNDQVWMNTGQVQPYGTGMMQMADVAAANAFNARDHKRGDSNWSGSAILRYAPSDGIALELGYAHKAQSPNLYQRYAWGRGAMASQMIGWFGDGNGYVGNLDLKPERADTISAAATFSGAGDTPWTIRVAPYVTHVADYIDAVKLADLTDMMGMPSGFVQLRFANREARFHGVDVSGDVTLWQGASGGKASLSAQASWVHGENLTDDDPLYHQMPFNASVALGYVDTRLDGRVEVTLVADKTRVDPTRNEPETQGYALVDLGGGYRFGMFRLGLDVTNLLDKRYDLPLGGMSLGDRKATGVLRPVPGRGRSVNVSLNASF